MQNTKKKKKELKTILIHLKIFTASIGHLITYTGQNLHSRQIAGDVAGEGLHSPTCPRIEGGGFVSGDKLIDCKVQHMLKSGAILS